MAEEQQNKQQEQSQEAQDKDKQAASSAATENTEQQPTEQTVPYSRFKEVNDRLKALEQDATKRAKEQEAENEKRLAEQAKWQELYEGSKGKLAELTPKAELADQLSEMVAQQYAAEIAEWPDQVKAMAPADDASILVKLDWLKRARPLAQELMEDKTPPAGNGRKPPPKAPAGDAKAAEQQRQRWRNQAARRYR